MKHISEVSAKERRVRTIDQTAPPIPPPQATRFEDGERWSWRGGKGDVQVMPVAIPRLRRNHCPGKGYTHCRDEAHQMRRQEDQVEDAP